MSRTLLVGDVHGCAAELGRLIDLARADRLVLLGDLFTKGPDPVGVWRLIQAHGAASVLGNHDERLLAGAQVPPGLPAGALDWLRQRPLFLEGPGWLAVHAGLHPILGRQATSRQQALYLRRWPDDRDLGHPFWWECWQPPPGHPLVVYGHDAVRGLQDRRPATLGLDSGCVYGGKLSGWVVESDEIVQVSALAVWCPFPLTPETPR